MASWSDAAHALPASRPQRRPPARQPRRVRARRRGLAGGVVWIGLSAVLLTGVVALNVAVLRLHVQVDKLDAERTRLRAEKQTLASQISMAAASPRILAHARAQNELVPADPSETTYVRLAPRAR
jgi:cell division protein FtsB